MPERMKPKPVVRLIVPTVRWTQSAAADDEAAAYGAEDEKEDTPDRQTGK